MKHRPPRRNAAHLDALLDGRPTASDPLADLVAAVRAPTQPHEMAGLDHALAAFASSSDVVLTPTEENPRMLTSVAGRLLALKILAVVAGTAAAGGVAYAAANGNPTTSNGHAAVAGASSGAPDGSAASSGSSSTDSGDKSSSSADEPSATESASGSGSASSSKSKSGAPSPSLVGLCNAWLAHPRDIAKVSTNPAFSVLINAAGGADAVNGYCTTVLTTAGHPLHSSHPTHPAHPTQARNTKSKSSGSESPEPSETTHTKKPKPSHSHHDPSSHSGGH
jgi:hypothetical protein